MGRGARRGSLVLTAALVAQVLAAAPTGAEDRVRSDETGRAALAASSDGPVRVAEHARTGRVRMVGAAPGRTLSVDAPRAATPEAAARGFLDRHGRAFGLADPTRDLRVAHTEGAARGAGDVVRFDQVHEGLPVLAGSLVVRTDAAGGVVSVAGEVLPDVTVDVRPDVAADDAAATARGVVARSASVPAGTLRSDAPVLAVFDPDLYGGPALPITRLVWQVDVGSSTDASLRDRVLVDAHTGGVAVQHPLVLAARDRWTCDNANVTQPAAWPPASCTAPARTETQPATGDAEVDDTHDLTGAVHDFLLAHFDRDSLDGAGMRLRSTVRWCDGYGPTCPMANAFWSGSEAYYGQGWATDDIVAHELVHGLTQYTSDLFYYYQSGAINESMSDVYGELFDLETGGDDDVANRWLVGEEVPVIGAIRDMADPPTFSDPDRIGSGHYWTAPGDAGGVHTNSGVNNKAASLLVDGGSFNGQTVGALGAAKVLQLYHEAQTALLTSGSDYADLADALEQACANLVGRFGISGSDCTQVAAAVTATEMRAAPPGPTSLDAPGCAASIPVEALQDDHDTGAALGGWTTSATGAGQPWGSRDDYAVSGDRALFAPNVGGVGTSVLATGAAVRVPGNAHVRFTHAYEFEPGDYDGGVLEYRTANDGAWVDATPLFDVNGPTGTIGDDHGNPLGGRSGFVGLSGGFTTSRVDLSSLAGEDVRFRWVVGNDSGYSAVGWFLDDVEVVGCDGDAPAFADGARLRAPDVEVDEVRLAWPEATDDTGVTGYVVSVDGEQVATTTEPGHTVTGLEVETGYELEVVARDAAGRSSAALALAVTTAARPTTGVGGVATPPREVARIAGGDRFETAAVTSRDAFPQGADTVFVATGRNFPDALAAGPVAGAEGAPILLVERDAVPTATAEEVVRLGARDVVVLGGQAAVSDAVVGALGALVPGVVTRVQGPDRYATAVEVSRRGFAPGVTVAYVATGTNFPDALAGAAAAGRDGGPVLLVRGDGVPDVVATELQRLAPQRIVVLGGEGAVQATVVDQLRGLAAADVVRVSGPDRYATAAAVAATFPAESHTAYVATGANFPDALTGTPPAVRVGAPILLVPGDTLPTAVADELTRIAPRRIVVLGGTAVVADVLANQLEGYLGS